MAYDFITREEHTASLKRIEKLESDIRLLLRLQGKDVGTEEAMRITNLSRRQLDHMRASGEECPLTWSKKGRRVTYDLESCLRFKESQYMKVA